MVPFAVVTGGSEGIGLAFAERLARQGMAVLLVARRVDVLEAAAARLRTGSGAQVETLALDVTSPGAAAAIERRLAENGGRLELLVNSAGMGLCDRFDEAAPEAIERLLSLNIGALTALMRHFLPGLTARRRGGIINLASLGGYVPGPNQAAYYASKAYVISLSEAVAQEVARDGVRVCVVSPGPVSTHFHARMGADSAFYRWVVPAVRPATVARWGLAAYRLRLRSVTPGVLNICTLVFLRILPHRLVVPVVAWLLQPRQRETRDV